MVGGWVGGSGSLNCGWSKLWVQGGWDLVTTPPPNLHPRGAGRPVGVRVSRWGLLAQECPQSLLGAFITPLMGGGELGTAIETPAASCWCAERPANHMRSHLAHNVHPRTKLD